MREPDTFPDREEEEYTDYKCKAEILSRSDNPQQVSR